MHDRHKQEMADFVREIKNKEINRAYLQEQAPEGIKHKLAQ